MYSHTLILTISHSTEAQPPSDYPGWPGSQPMKPGEKKKQKRKRKKRRRRRKKKKVKQQISNSKGSDFSFFVNTSPLLVLAAAERHLKKSEKKIRDVLCKLPWD